MLMPEFEVLDPRFAQLVLGNVHLERLYTGCRWAEGPAYLAAGKYLVWSDIPNDRVMRWDETDATVSVFQQPAWHANGHTVDRQGRLLSCEHRGRCVSRIEHDGSRTVLAAQYDGKRLNSPNDLVVKSDDSIWFTDPTYGIDSEYEGDAAASEMGASNVYRIDGVTGALQVVIADMLKPNGLAFSPDESRLYVADTGASHVSDGPRHLRCFAVRSGGAGVHDGGPVLARCDSGFFDGLRVDRHGNIWTSTADGVSCLGPDGGLLGKIRVPEVVANVCFGGPKRNRLFICGTTSLYAVFLNTVGATWPT